MNSRLPGMCKRSLQDCREQHQARWITECHFSILIVWLHTTLKMLGRHVLFVLQKNPLTLHTSLYYICYKELKKNLLCFYKYKLLLQYGDLEKYIHIISDNKHIIQTKIKKKQNKNK